MIGSNTNVFRWLNHGKGLISLVVLSIILVTNILVFMISDPLVTILVTVLLFYFLPGFLFYLLFYYFESSEFEIIHVIVLSLSIGVVISTYYLYLFSFFSIEFNKVNLVLSYSILAIILTGFVLVRSNVVFKAKCDLNSPELLILGLILLITIYFRFVHLGYSELQGDEAAVTIASMNLIDGRSNVMFESKKGPTQSLAPIPFYLINGYRTELITRAPFAFAGVLNVFLIYILVKSMFDKRIGLSSALLYSVTGLNIAFARIAQYQSILILTMLLAMVYFYESLKNTSNIKKEKNFLWGTFFFAFGLFTHWDIIFLTFVVVFIWYKNFGLRYFYSYQVFYKALFMFLVFTLIFYVPFILNPRFENTMSYYAWRSGVNSPRTHIAWFAILISFYSSSYLLFFLLIFPFFNLLQKNFTLELKINILWFFSYFIPLTLIMKLPGSHFYPLLPSWIPLSLIGLNQLFKTLVKKNIKLKPFKGPILIILTLCSIIPIIYSQMLFVDHNVLYTRTYPEHKNDFFFTLYDEQPEEFKFGFPYKAGWKVVGYLFKSDILRGSYCSNEEYAITYYYTGARPLCGNAKYFIIAKYVQDERDLNKTHVEITYDLMGVVYVHNKPMIKIYDSSSPIDDNHVRYDVEDYEKEYDHKYGKI